MVDYKCGHKTSGIIIMDSNPLSIVAYLEWDETVGLHRDKSECFDCFAKRTSRFSKQEK
jgi:hypothetical protein